MVIDMKTIIPSTELKVISVQKLRDTVCWRLFFWQHILNLEPRKLNFNFWYGGILGATFEQMLLNGKYNPVKIKKIIDDESNKRIKRYKLMPDDIEEIRLQKRLIDIILDGVTRQDFFKKMKMTEHQVETEYQIMEGIKFFGILDGLGKYDKQDCTFEIKTASRVTNETFTALQYDKQVYGYPIGLKLSKKKYPVKCCYIIFRKPQKRIKKNQNEDDFVQEIKEDIEKRPEFYYINYPMTLGKDTMEYVRQDILSHTKILKLVYDSMTKKEIVNPENWPKCEKQCLSYGACPYIMLCQHFKNWKLYSNFYQEREHYKKDKEKQER